MSGSHLLHWIRTIGFLSERFKDRNSTQYRSADQTLSCRRMNLAHSPAFVNSLVLIDIRSLEGQ